MQLRHEYVYVYFYPRDILVQNDGVKRHLVIPIMQLMSTPGILNQPSKRNTGREEGFYF